MSLIDRFARSLRHSQEVHPIDGKLAKQWIKQRLVVVFPELKNNPRALEAAYQSLDLSPREGDQEGEPEAIFELKYPTQR